MVTGKRALLTNTNIFLDSNLLNATYADFIPLQKIDGTAKPLLHWLVRRVEVTRGSMPIRMECAPAFNYARDPHETSVS